MIDYDLQQPNESDVDYANRLKKIRIAKMPKEDLSEFSKAIQREADNKQLTGTIIEINEKFAVVSFNKFAKPAPNRDGVVLIRRSNVYAIWPMSNNETSEPIKLAEHELKIGISGKLLCLYDNPIPVISAQTWIFVVNKK